MIRENGRKVIVKCYSLYPEYVEKIDQFRKTFKINESEAVRLLIDLAISKLDKIPTIISITSEWKMDEYESIAWKKVDKICDDTLRMLSEVAKGNMSINDPIILKNIDRIDTITEIVKEDDIPSNIKVKIDVVMTMAKNLGYKKRIPFKTSEFKR